MEDGESGDGGRRATILLALGAAAGLGLAAFGLLTDAGARTADLPEGMVARVNDAWIRGEDYGRLLAGLESDTRAPADERMRRHVLDRMIDEELLVQRALELGLAQVDRRVRADLTSALIASVVSGVDDREPEPEELEAFFEENRDFFTAPGRLRVRQVFFRARDAEDEARVRVTALEARRRLLAGEDFEAVRDDLGHAEISRVPDTYLPATKLREYLGPTAMRAAAQLEVGGVSEPVRSGTGVHVIQLVDREFDRTPELAEALPQVASEWRRRAGDQALREYLDGLREQADVVTVPDLGGEE